MTGIAGVLLAAGAGRRMGLPKVLLRDGRGVPYLDRAIGALVDGGCDSVTVVLGAAADEARVLLESAGWLDDEAVHVVDATDWADGMGASLRTGLDAVATTDAQAALVSLVDLPDVSDAVVARLLETPVSAESLARATYDGSVGHPVLLGRAHWPAVGVTATGDVGARDYLEAHEVLMVECGDLGSGRDMDVPHDL